MSAHHFTGAFVFKKPQSLVTRSLTQLILFCAAGTVTCAYAPSFLPFSEDAFLTLGLGFIGIGLVAGVYSVVLTSKAIKVQVQGSRFRSKTSTQPD